MAAYAALLSLMHIIDNLRLHPRPPINLHHKQAHFLTEKVTHLLDFLRRYNPRLGYSTEADPLELRIADAAYAAEDIIESHIVDQITGDGGEMSFEALYQALDKVIQDMNLIEEEAMEIERGLGVLDHVQENSTYSDSKRSSSMVGVEDVKIQLMDKLTSDCRDLLIIPIAGMGGTGKTTLARAIYQERLITEHFDTCAWATISQEYSVTQILAEILGLGNDQHSSVGELGEKLHKHLFGRRYLVVMDDMWDIQAWDRVRVYFPNNKNGSRVVVTTRLSNLASDLSSKSSSLEMGLLDEAHSWDLLSKTVFAEESCPLHLEEIGKRIAKSCKGLPLSIVVIGGLLSKSEHTSEFWEYIEKNLSPIVNLEDDERCLKILQLSYKQLPVHLKPCFLYMGIFSEDEVIHASRVVRLWIAEGFFIKPVSGKSSKEVGKMYVKELADRNLVLVHKIGSIGGIKECKMHDLLRDFCLREARKERFYSFVDGEDETNARRGIVIPTTSMEEVEHALQSMPQTRSLIWGQDGKPPSLRLRWLRIIQSTKPFVYQETMLQLVNLRHVTDVSLEEESVFPSMQRFWNLETLIIKGNGSKFSLPAEIWCMPHMRHIQVKYVHLPDPPVGHAAADDNGDDGGCVLQNLHSLKRITNFKCSEDVVKRIPNIKKLGVYYNEFDERLQVENLVSLDKLESLKFVIFQPPPKGTEGVSRMDGQSLNFPHSLKKLTLGLHYSKFSQQVLGMIGVLPHLEKLRLDSGSFEERKWETVEGQFSRLKFLEISRSTIVEWKMEGSHFPRLEKLVLRRLYYMQEIPLEVAEIPTLGSIYFMNAAN
ncbi:putative late blight resistance protein homolog R1B-16 isoform X2 [Salvia hispanica]|uniref:putative late blight resistance protein homolog R1B-16 isoform X2 n=1 Tax=Salvia hispanica TaxID=49212 RepID=UPI002009C366|nr:putative late blight resistance protein homolog R1B-16 isoform X2 [Salvia hispanica]